MTQSSRSVVTLASYDIAVCMMLFTIRIHYDSVFAEQGQNFHFLEGLTGEIKWSIRALAEAYLLFHESSDWVIDNSAGLTLPGQGKQISAMRGEEKPRGS